MTVQAHAAGDRGISIVFPDEKHPVEQLHRTIGRNFTLSGAKLPEEFLTTLELRVLLPWAHYAVMTYDLDVPQVHRRRIRTLWETASQVEQVETPVRRLTSTSVGAVAQDKPGDTPQALRAMRDSELQATNPAEFMSLLRTIQVRSRNNPARIAKIAGISRSQSYRFVTRPTLPTKPEDVEAFVTACGLQQEQVQRVMALWSELRELNADTTAVIGCDRNRVIRLTLPAWSVARWAELVDLGEPTGDGAPGILNADGSLIHLKWVQASALHGGIRHFLNGLMPLTHMPTTDCPHQATPGLSFAQAVRTLREQRGLSEEHLSGLARCSTTSLSDLENAVTVPEPELLDRLDAALDAGGLLAAFAPRCC
ncbi:multiprotein-bridging factor 1 family protein [Lentzea sp. NPDC102401]|uniref:helix-turn-helix domain-containing protein n=1 Tax=Lentzea sp. NPDC102401 TaxID=3364128 RepID=UPI003807F4F5